MIHKSFSKQDLIHIINSLNVPVIFNHSINKKEIQDKLVSYYHEKEEDIKKDNVYGIDSKQDLFIYLSKPNPKKTLNIKEKNNIMNICKSIIRYCNNKYDLNYTSYSNLQDIVDDMNYIKQYGDIPSVRRCCKLMNNCCKVKEVFKPLISPQVKQMLQEKAISKQQVINCLTIKREKIVLSFD
tara:strand:- start:16750 stop:17298 length:549 start_codon:yes stop_codon:yes gene_type:complete